MRIYLIRLHKVHFYIVDFCVFINLFYTIHI